MSENKRQTVKDLAVFFKTSSAPVLLGEYRGTKVEKVSWKDKVTGKEECFHKVSHTIEVTDATGAVSSLVDDERQPKTFDGSVPYVAGVNKGQVVALRLSSFQRSKGVVSASIEAEHGMCVVG